MPTLILLLGLLSAWACPVNQQVLTADIQTAKAAYVSFDWVAFDSAVASLRLHVGCLEEPISPEVAAGVHLAQALFAWRARDEAQVDAALRGMRHASPEAQLPPEIAPPGHPLAQRFDLAQGLGATVALPPGQWRVDGHPDVTTVVTDRAAILQQVDPRGALRTWYWWGGELPKDLAPVSALPLDPPGAFDTKSSPRAQQLVIAAGGAAALGLVGLGVAARTDHLATSDPASLQQYRRLLVVNRTALVLSPALGAAALSLGVGAALTWQW